MSISPKIDGVSIVMLGSFNPSIINPEWLERHGIINESQKDYALRNPEDVIHQTLSSFKIAEDIEITTTIDRFSIEGEFVRYLEIRDIVVGTFELLEHTPVTAIGINRHMHFEHARNIDFENLCETTFSEAHLEDSMESPRISSLTIVGKRQDENEGIIRVKIEPSKSKSIDSGVFVSINNHIQGNENKNVDLMKILKNLKDDDSWVKTCQFALDLAERLI